MPAQEAIDLLVQAANAAQTERTGSTLSPAERMALRYFARANRFSRNECALAEFQSIGLSSAVQLVGALTEGGYLTRETAQRGEIRLDLTPKSRALLADDPYGRLLRAISALEPDKQALLCQSLRGVLDALADDSAHWYLNSCRNCCELALPEGGAAASGTARCKLFDTGIETGDLDSLCIDFSPRPKARKGDVQQQ